MQDRGAFIRQRLRVHNIPSRLLCFESEVVFDSTLGIHPRGACGHPPAPPTPCNLPTFKQIGVTTPQSDGLQECGGSKVTGPRANPGMGVHLGLFHKKMRVLKGP